MPKRDPYAQSQQFTKVPTAKVPRSKTTVTRTPTKTTVRKTTRTGDFASKGDSGGGGNFSPSGKADTVNLPPPSPTDKIAAAVTASISRMTGTLVQAAADQAVPHRPSKPPKPPKKVFPAVKEPSPEQAIYRAQADRLAQQLPALTKTMEQRRSAAQSVRDQIDQLIKTNGKLNKATGKTMLEPDDYKRFEALSKKLKTTGDRAQEAVAAHNDVVTRVWELDRAYKRNTPSPAWAPKPQQAPALRPDMYETLGIERKPAFDFGGKQGGIPGLTPRKGGPLLPALKPGEERGGLLSNIIEGTVGTAGKVGKSLLPIDEGHFGAPEAYQRFHALGDVGATGIIEGSKGAYNIVKRQIEHDRRKTHYLMKRQDIEREKGRPLTFPEQKRLASGMGVNLLEAGPLDKQNFINFAAGAAGVGVGLWADPVAVARDIAKLGVDATVGTGLLVAALSRPDLTYEQRRAMLAEMPKGIRDEYTKHFGRGLSAFEAFDRAKDEPISTALLYPTPLAGATQGARVLTIMRFGLKGGKDMKTAIRLARDPEKMRTLTYTERAPKGSGVESVKTKVPVPYGFSSSVLIRNAAQRPYDVGTRLLDSIPGARRLPIAMSNRGARALGKGERMTKNRRGAEVQAHYKNIEQFLNERDRFGRKKNKHFATTLAVLVQKPKGFTDDEWERAVIQNMRDMLADPDRMDLPGDEVTPAEQKLINAIARYDKKAENERASKRGLTMRRLHGDQRRLGENLARITAEREDVHDAWLALQGQGKPPARRPGETREQWAERLNVDYGRDLVNEYDIALTENLAAQQQLVRAKPRPDDYLEQSRRLEAEREQLLESKADQRAEYEGQMRALDSEADVMREQLAEISVAQPPIMSPRRTQMRRELEKLVYFQDYPEAIDDVLLAGDAAARNWAKIKGRRPEEWWELRDVRGEVDPGDIPLEAYAQSRPEGATDVPDPAALDRKAQEVYDRYGHMGGAMPPGVENAAGWAAKGHEVARLATLGAKHRHWYRDSGLAIRDRLGPDNWNDARQIAAAVAYLSRTDSVVPNVGHAMRAYTSFKETGDAGLAGRYPQVANEKLNEIFKKNAWGGYKTNSFFRNILEEYDPARFKKEFGEADEDVDLDLGDEGEEVTVDRWIVRAFGFDDDNVSAKGRYFAAREMIQHIAEQLGWKPKEVQAAIWVAVKAEKEAAKSAEKVAARNIVNKGKHDAKVAKAAETGRGGPRSDWEPEQPKTAEDFLEASGVHVGSSLDKITHQLRVNAEAAPGSTYAGFPEYATFSKHAQDEFAREIANGVYAYNRKLGIPFVPGERGPGLFEPEGAPIETNPAFASNISIGSTMRAPTAKKYGLERVPEWQRTEFDAIVAGQGLGTRQNAMPWIRPMVAEKASDRTAYFVTHENLTTDDMLALRAMRGRGNANWQIAISHGDGGVWFTLVKGSGMSQSRFSKKVGSMVDRHFGEDADVQHFAHEGGYVENDWKNGSADYEVKIAKSRRASEIRAASDALADHYESTRVRFTGHPDGPDGAARELRAERAAREPEAPEADLGVQPVRAQSRRQDTLGATQLINSATGERIIWLTEHADFSTVIHELLGHAVEEMKDLHPEEFARAERAMGKSLDAWTVEDHEKFAGWFERYLFEGHAPTPELVPTFDRSKQYMRVIYQATRHKIGPRIPHETRDLFDHYLGGWDSESSTRIAVNMGHYDPSDSPWAGARMAAQDELQTLQKRNRTRRFNQTVEGMMEKLKALEKKADKVDNQAERDELAAQIVRLQAEIVLRSDKRVKSLTSKINDMEKALTRDPNNRRFTGALESAKFMMEDRERILREAFGDENFDEMFSNRRDLLANYLVQHGLLQPDFEHGTGTYFPMKLDEGFLQSLKLPMTPASNRVIGEVQRSMVGVHHRNEMIRWQAGDWSADPAVLQLAHARAMSYQFVLEVRELMHSMGRELTAAERRDPKRALPSGGYVVNLNGTPLSPDMKAATRGMTNTTTVDNLDDGLFGDNEKLEATLKDFFRNSIVDLDDMPPGFNLDDDNLRFISKGAVNKIFRPVSLNLGGRYFDWLNTAARFSLIYANMPGYMITNLAGNLVFLTAQQGLNWIPRSVFYGKMLKNDDFFRARVSAEGGMLPAYSAITRGRNFSQMTGEKLRAGERWWLGFESKVDEWPRMIAWMAEANKKGYYSKESMLRLLDGKTAKTKRDREYVAERTNQHMIDFTYRVSDRERAVLGRLLFIWPYIRGATAMPFWYGKNYPARTALIAQLALQQREYQEAMLGDLPPGREDLYAYDRKGSRGVGRGVQATTLGTRYFNPAGPVPDEIQMASDLIASAFGRKPDNLSARLSSLLNVNIENTIGLVTGRDAFGRDISLKDQVLNPYGIADSLVPFIRYARAAFSDEYTPRAFREGEGDSFLERFYRSGLRVPQQTVSVDWLNASAQSRGEKTTEQKIEEGVVANMKHFHKIAGASAHYPSTLRKQVAAQVIYDDRVADLEREQAAKARFIPKQKDDGTWDFGYTADEYDKALVAWEVMKQQFPEVLAHHDAVRVKNGLPPLSSPNEKLAEARVPPRSEGGKKYAQVYIDIFNTVLKTRPDEKGIKWAGFYDQRYEKLMPILKYKDEKSRGVYRGREAALKAKRTAALREYGNG